MTLNGTIWKRNLDVEYVSAFGRAGPVQFSPAPLQLPLVDQLHLPLLRQARGAGADRLRLIQGPH